MAKNNSQWLKDATPLIIVGGVGYLLYRGGFFSRISEGLGGAVQGIGGGIAEAAGGLGQGLSDVAQGAGDFALGLGRGGFGLGSGVSEAAMATGGFIRRGFESAGDILDELGDQTEEVVETVGQGGRKLLGAAFAAPFAAFNAGVNIGEGLKARGRATVATVKGAVSSAKGFVTNSVNESRNIVRDRLASARTTVQSTVAKAKTAISNIIKKGASKRGR